MSGVDNADENDDKNHSLKTFRRSIINKDLSHKIFLKYTIQYINRIMALVEKSSPGMMSDNSKMDNNIVNDNGNNVVEKYELRWKGFEGNLIR
jgi:hypothetical protein